MILRRATLALPFLAPPLLARRAAAQAPWPSRPVRIIVAFPPGGPADVLARLLAEHLAPGLGQPIVVENRTGAGGIIGTAAAATATDQHTLLLGSVSMAIVPHLQPTPVPYDILRDFVAVGVVAVTSLVLVVPDASPFRSFQDLLDKARASPGTVTAGNPGNGTIGHLTVELLNARTGAGLQPVAYRGEALLMPDLLTGTVSCSFMNLPTALPQLRSGRLRALAVAAPAALPDIPDVPTLDQLGLPGIAIAGWQGLLANRTVPDAGIARLSALLRAELADTEVRQGIAAIGAAPGNGDRAAFAALLRADYDRFGTVVRERGIKAE